MSFEGAVRIFVVVIVVGNSSRSRRLRRDAGAALKRERGRQHGLDAMGDSSNDDDVISLNRTADRPSRQIRANALRRNVARN